MDHDEQGRRDGAHLPGRTATGTGLRGRLQAAPVLVPLAITVAVLVAWAGWAVAQGGGSGEGAPPPAGSVGGPDGTPVTSRGSTTTALPGSSSTSTSRPPFEGWVDPASFGRPWGDVEGLLTFRGNPTRSWYGRGPVPRDPTVVWSYPPGGGGLCGLTTVEGVEEQWCGTGWTGQPAVWERDGRTWVAFGAYDHAVHLLDGRTGGTLLPPFPTGDLIKGSVTVDPDGFPILYTGSRDGFYRAIALDRDQPVELWRFDADSVSPTLWNDDWDGSGLVIDDHLFVGGENSRIHIWRLRRGYDDEGRVTVDPELVFHAAGWDQQLLDDLGDTQVSIENSVAISGDTLYFSNGGGLVQGWDIGGLRRGETPTRTFRFWTGDDTDASIVVDEQGYLYVASELERTAPPARSRAEQIGQIVKLDPRRPDDPVVWSVPDAGGEKAGAWGTVGIWGDTVYATFNSGRVVGLDRATGEVRWTKRLPGPVWQSPVIVDDVLILGDCSGVLRAYDVSDPTVEPPELWRVQLVGCIESTPAVWRGRIYVGARGGRFYAIGDAVDR